MRRPGIEIGFIILRGVDCSVQVDENVAAAPGPPLHTIPLDWTEQMREAEGMAEITGAAQRRTETFEKMLSQFKPLFWDTDIGALDMTVNRQYIISRLLSMGGMPGYLWVTRHYSEEAIVEAIIQRRDMHPIMRNFMAERYHIPKDQLVKARTWR